MTMQDNLCECCGKNPAIGVASLPAPISIAWCKECLESGAMPYWFLLGNTALIGGLEKSAEWWKEDINITLSYFNIPQTQFECDLSIEMAAQAYFGKEYFESNPEPLLASEPFLF